MVVPKHIGLIMDGNRRFAKRLMLKPWKGHEWGYEKVKKVMHWCKEYDIRELTLYAFSLENFDRPKEEFDYLMDLCEKAFIELKNEKEKMKDVCVTFIGRIQMFPEKVQKAMNDLMEETKGHTPFRINFAMGNIKNIRNNKYFSFIRICPDIWCYLSGWMANT